LQKYGDMEKINYLCSKIYFFKPTGATTANLPPGVLYRVKATYKYVREDTDELSFDVGETINVIEYDDPEDQVKLLFF
jgi:hypothetical protein